MLLLVGCDDAVPRAVSHGAAARVATSAAHKLLASDGDAGDHFGAASSAAGDLNGDGYADIIVGALRDDDNGTAAGAAYVYYGGATGLTSAEHKLLASDGGAGDRFGAWVAGAGDIDADGYGDLIVGAPDDDRRTGAAYVYFGSATGIRAASEVKVTAADGAARDRFGVSVGGGGDLNNDGYSDVVIGTVRDAVYVYYGSGAGLLASADKLVPADGADGDRYGASVSVAGDVDGDGYDDIIVGASRSGGDGAAYIHYGSASGVGAGAVEKLTASNATAGAQMGRHVSGAGDVNRDGYADVIIGAQANAPDGDGVARGAAYIYYGGSGGVVAEDVLFASDRMAGDRFGHGVSGAGDLNADGYDDVLVSADGVDDNGTDAGAAYLYYGSMSGVLRSTEEKLLAADGHDGHHFGQSAAGAGDIDADGHDDILVAARDDDAAGAGAGSVHVYYGYADVDGDGVKATEDCDDRDAAIGGPSTRYVDADGDGYGDPDTAAAACQGAAGLSAEGGDCDDLAADIHPGAADTCGDGVDADCDSIGGPLGDEDGDGLSYAAEAELGSDDCDTDTDDDGLTDDLEVDHGTDVNNPDSDGDGLSDGYEVHTSGTDPNDGGTPDTGEVIVSEPDPDTGASTTGLSGESHSGCATRGGAPLGWAALLGLLAVGCRREQDPLTAR